MANNTVPISEETSKKLKHLKRLFEKEKGIPSLTKEAVNKMSVDEVHKQLSKKYPEIE